MCLLFPFCLLPFSLDPTPVGLLRLLCLCPSSKAIPVIVIDDIQIAKLISQVSVFIQFDPSATLDTASHSLFLKTLCSVSFHKTTQPWVCFLLPYWLLLLCPSFGSSSASWSLNVEGSLVSVLGPLPSVYLQFFGKKCDKQGLFINHHRSAPHLAKYMRIPSHPTTKITFHCKLETDFYNFCFSNCFFMSNAFIL